MRPASAIEDLVGQIENWRAAGIRDELGLQRLKRKVEQLKSSQHKAEAYMLLGMIACLRDDPESMRSNHETALRIDPYNSLLISNYCTSLLASGYIAEGLAKEREALDVEETRERVREIVGTLYACGRLSEALSIMNDNNIDTVGESSLTLDEIREQQGVLDSFSLSDDECQAAIETVYQVMHDSGYYFHANSLDLQRFDEVSWLSFIVSPASAKSATEVVELNYMLSEVLAKNNLKVFESGAFVARFVLPQVDNNNVEQT